MYSKVYWYGQIPELLLLLAVIINMALVLFRPHGKWLPGTRKLVQIGAVVAILIALLLTWLGEPSAPTTLWSWLIRGNLFSAVLTTELALAIILTAFFMGLSWNEWVTGLAVGLMLRFSITCLVEGAHTYLGVGPFYKALVHIRMYAEILALCYWIRTFYRKEPELPPLPPEMLESLARLNRAR